MASVAATSRENIACIRAAMVCERRMLCGEAELHDKVKKAALRFIALPTRSMCSCPQL